jgi:catalase
MFTEEQAEAFSFDVLDATKLIPEELVPLTPVGKMVLDRNPDNFFAETEQVAFCTAHIVPGLDFSSDPLLAGRIHSYVDTQISRLGGPNFHEIPINAPVVQVHNNQRDGMHRQAIPRGKVSYEPNSLGGGCPFQAGKMGFTSFREPMVADKVRGKAERFAEHYAQATLFWNSQSPIERAHILRGFRFELSRVTVPAIRSRVVSMLANVDRELASMLAKELGMEMPEPMPRAGKRVVKPEIEVSPKLSIFSDPGDGSIQTRRVAILVSDGSDLAAARAIHAGLLQAGAVPRYVGVRLGTVKGEDQAAVEVEATLETTPSVLYDALAVPGGKKAIEALGKVGHALELIKDQHRHLKPILALGSATDLIEGAGVPAVLPSGAADPGLLVGDVPPENAIPAFIKAIARHRHPERASDPPAL